MPIITQNRNDFNHYINFLFGSADFIPQTVDFENFNFRPDIFQLLP